MEFFPPSDQNSYNQLQVYPCDTQSLVSTETHDSIWRNVSSLLCNGSGFNLLSPENYQAETEFRTLFPDRFGVTEEDLNDLMLKLDGAHTSCGLSQGWITSDIHGTVSGLVPDQSQCGCAASRDELENYGNAISNEGQAAGVKIHRYSGEERKDRILRYLRKRNQRNFNKTIKYACRKTLADKRRRVRGRFASNSEIQEAVEQHHDISEIQDINNNGDDLCDEAMYVYNWLNDMEF